ncbi:endonuclease/exonuclease/phosphatase family protein [Proteiniphilum sp.]|uniref:endonuclease/exonuclease/phosphatase family protein n=1 Tax=Proteiniphilum sp. TaxID=1926877 RepID=UPI00331B9A44
MNILPVHFHPLLSCVIGLILLSCSPGKADENEDTIKAVTYNIYSTRNSSIGKIAEVIRDINPDLVSLQEIERFTDINPSDVPATLSELTGMKYHYFIHALDIESGGDYGNAILSKYPILDAATYKLYGVEETDYVRSFGYIKVQKGSKEFYFAATHLDHKGNDASRMKMVHEILGIVKELDAPVILGGDMNAQPTQKPMTTLHGWFNMPCFPDMRPTVPAPGPAETTIDYVLYGPDKAFQLKEYKVYYDAEGASDHFPVVATFTID